MGDTRLLAIDPSLTRTGVCALDYTTGGTIRDGYSVLEAVKTGRYASDLSYIDRSKLMVNKTIELLDLVGPNEIVIEVPEGRVTGRHAGGGSGLAKYGFLVGYLYYELCIYAGDNPLHAVGSSFWTQGFGQAKRKKKASSKIKTLSGVKDPGGDIADAAALAVWWIEIGRFKDSCLST